MLTYQVRPRVFKCPEGPLTFPGDCVVRFHLAPPQAFGESGDGRTAVRGVETTILFDTNTGAHSINSAQPLTPIEATLRDGGWMVKWRGSLLTASGHCYSPEELSDMVLTVYFLMPPLLNVRFADPPYVTRVEGEIGGRSFAWELIEFRFECLTTTQEKQERFAAQGWTRLGLVRMPHRKRLAAGLHYFHTACRLARQGSTPGEFVAEVVLNLAKTLEVLFPPSGDGRTRDAARAGLRNLQFSDDEIERGFLPAMALRNEIDVGHVELGLFSVDQLKVIHAYTDQAEQAFREMLGRLLDGVENGTADVPPYELRPPRAEAVQVIERLRAILPKESV